MTWSGATLFVLAVAAITAAVPIYFSMRSLQRSHFRVLALRQSEDKKALRESEVRYRTLFDSISGNAATQEIVTAHGTEAHQFTLLSEPVLPKQMLAHVEALLAHLPLELSKNQQGESSDTTDSCQTGSNPDTQ